MALAFGTSGIRGLVTEFNQDECSRYVAAFVHCLKQKNVRFNEVVLADDLRDSSPQIKMMIAKALTSFNVQILDAGTVPTPVLAWSCSDLNIPGIMITGSHIPADRNGFKFYLAEGEILKEDEKIIFDAYTQMKSTGEHPITPQIKPIDASASYVKRYLAPFGENCLKGLRLGFYQHSSVGRDLFVEILTRLGASVTPFGREDTFIPVDTEAVTAVGFLKTELQKQKFDAIVSTDGDADRPLVMADDGQIVPGEILGLITSRELKINTVVCPISCSSLIEKSGWIDTCERTQIGSPFVLGKINELKEKFPERSIAGFEANGGYILSTEAHGLKPLNTRDSLLPILAVLVAAQKRGEGKISALLAKLPKRVNQSGLIKDFAREKALAVLKRVDEVVNSTKIFKGCELLGKIASVNRLDGPRMTFDSGIIVHLRPSGNAPEFRIYVEAASISLAQQAMAGISAWIQDA